MLEMARGKEERGMKEGLKGGRGGEKLNLKHQVHLLST